jgi:hypothetical protein
MLSSFIISIDYFSASIELYFNKEKKMKTLYGGVVSILMYLACLAFTINIGIHLVFRLNPTTITSTQSQPHCPTVDFYKEDMIFAFSITDSNLGIINDPSIATFSVVQQIINRTDPNLYYEIPVEIKNCSKYQDYFIERGFETDYLNNDIDNSFCLSRENPIVIGGTYTDPYYSAIQISLTKCTNGTSIVCKSEEEINERLKMSYFQLYYLDWNVDPNNYEKPFNRYFSNYFILLDPTAVKMSNIYFKPAVINSNLGLICSGKKDILFYNAAYRKLNSYIDYIKVTKMLKQFRQLKKVILNQDQNKLFKYHNKQIISLQNVGKDNLGEQKDVNYLELYNVFQKFQEEAKKDEICKRLVENFDKNLAFIFETVGSSDKKPHNFGGKGDIELDILKIN